jgi:hypothetical protein
MRNGSRSLGEFPLHVIGIECEHLRSPMPEGCSGGAVNDGAEG